MYDKKEIIRTMENIANKTLVKVPKNYMGMRSITKETMSFFDVRTVTDRAGKPEKIIFPYGDDAQKIRSLKEKEFVCTGNMKEASLFGMDKFTPGQAKSVTITEGEFDALSVFQALGSKYPVVSVRSSTTAKSDCSVAYDWLNAFERIYLCLDQDAPGERASRDIAKLFDLNKVYFVKLGQFKDANEMLQAGKEKEFVNVWYNSKRFVPKGVVSTLADLNGLLEKQRKQSIASYPFPSLQEMTYGIRSKELIVITAQEKIGKTEFIRAIEYDLLKNTNHNIGIVHLEEDETRTVQGLVGLDLKQPVHLPDSMVSLSDQQKVLAQLVKTDDRLAVYPHFGSDDPNMILDIIRYMVSGLGCKFIFIDHITMLVTGFEGEDERKKLDYLSTKFAEMTRELDFTMFLISHVNDDGKTRGSRNITKMADLIISLYRDIEAADENIRNTTTVTVRGNRFCGRTGPAGYLFFDPTSFTLSELSFANSNDPGWMEQLIEEAA